MKKPRPASRLHAAGPTAFREGLSRFATGVTVVTISGKKEKLPLGVTISSFAGLSLSPPLVLFCLDEKARIRPVFKTGATFAVNILAETQKRLARHFAHSGAHLSKKIPHTSVLRTPFLEEAAAVLLCKLEKKLKNGDHIIVIGRVKKIILHPDNPAPLLHARRKYWNLGKAKR